MTRADIPAAGRFRIGDEVFWRNGPEDDRIVTLIDGPFRIQKVGADGKLYGEWRDEDVYFCLSACLRLGYVLSAMGCMFWRAPQERRCVGTL